MEEIKSHKNSHKNLKSPFYEDFKSPSTKTFPQRVRTEGSLYYDAIQKPLRHPPLIIAIKNRIKLSVCNLTMLNQARFSQIKIKSNSRRLQLGDANLIFLRFVCLKIWKCSYLRSV